MRLGGNQLLPCIMYNIDLLNWGYRHPNKGSLFYRWGQIMNRKQSELPANVLVSPSHNTSQSWRHNYHAQWWPCWEDWEETLSPRWTDLSWRAQIHLLPGKSSRCSLSLWSHAGLRGSWSLCQRLWYLPSLQQHCTQYLEELGIWSGRKKKERKKKTKLRRFVGFTLGSTAFPLVFLTFNSLHLFLFHTYSQEMHSYLQTVWEAGLCWQTPCHTAQWKKNICFFNHHMVTIGWRKKWIDNHIASFWEVPNIQYVRECLKNGKMLFPHTNLTSQKALWQAYYRHLSCCRIRRHLCICFTVLGTKYKTAGIQAMSFLFLHHPEMSTGPLD